MSKLTVTVDATVPSGATAEVTVFEDVDGDGVPENNATTTVNDGKNSYDLSGFDGSSGNQVYIRLELDNGDNVENTPPTVDSVAVSA